MNYPLTLEQYITQASMQEAELARMGAQIAEALSVIHQQGRVHGAVKPGNILVLAPGSYQLIGYESVRKYPEGTIPTFAAPELEQGGTYQAGTDVYALGMMMKSLIPKQGISGVLDEVIQKACEPDPGRRYATALEFGEPLQMIADALQDSTGVGQQPYIQDTEPQGTQQPYIQGAPQNYVQRMEPQGAPQNYVQRMEPQDAPQNYMQKQEQPERRQQPQRKPPAQQPKEKTTKETQKASLVLRFLLPILLVLLIGAAVLVYIILIRPSGQDEETTATTRATTTEATTEAATETTTEVTTEATTEEVECPYEYEQKITVTAHAGSTSGTLTLYNWENGDWVKKFAVACVLGRNGIGSDYGEGKGVTPMGTFKLGFVMANVDPKNNMNFKLASSTAAIVDDAESDLYNTLVDTESSGDVSVDPIGSNIVNGKLNAIIYIEHNGDGLSSDGVTPGKGSVITICGNYNEVSETAGCIDITADNMTQLLRQLDGNRNPYIEITLN